MAAVLVIMVCIFGLHPGAPSSLTATGVQSWTVLSDWVSPVPPPSPLKHTPVGGLGA